MAKQLKVGDKVRYIEECGWYEVGTVLYVIKIDYDSSMSHLLSADINGNEHGTNNLWVEASEIEIVATKPSKNERITALESQVAKLTAKVEALEKPKFDTNFQTFIKKDRSTPNEQRKAVIERAKDFVGRQQALTGRRVEYVVNAEKRTVVALIYRIAFRGERNGLYAKATAKCAPDDVFNADIGKAISLGRALGLDVSEFENAVKPTEVVVGMVVYDDDKSAGSAGNVIVEEVRPPGYCNANDGYTYVDGWAWLKKAVIIDDTGAQY